MTLRTLTAAAAVALMTPVNPPLRVSGAIHLFLWTHHIGVPARFVYLVAVWAAAWMALGLIRSVWRPTPALEASLWLMSGAVIAGLLAVFAVMDARHTGRAVCYFWVESRCVAGEILVRTAYDQAALEATAAGLIMWFAVVGSRTSRKGRTHPA